MKSPNKDEIVEFILNNDTDLQLSCNVGKSTISMVIHLGSDMGESSKALYPFLNQGDAIIKNMDDKVRAITFVLAAITSVLDQSYDNPSAFVDLTEAIIPRYVDPLENRRGKIEVSVTISKAGGHTRCWQMKEIQLN